MVNDSTAERSACVALTVYNRPCEVPALTGEDVCETHAIARGELENWWEWADREAAEEFRSRQLHELRSELLGVGVPVNTDEPLVLRVADQEFTVRSGSRGGLRYSVTLIPEPDGTAIYECPCRGWMMNRRCSHVDQVIEFIGPDALPQKLAGWAEDRAQCSAITARGTRCRNTALEGLDYCGTHRPKVEVPAEVEPEEVFVGTYTPNIGVGAHRRRVTAAWLALVLGFVGAHQFYLGNRGRGFLMLVLFFIFWPATLIWGWVNAIGLFAMSDQVFDDAYKR